MIKAVIFDMDGLLINSEPFWRQAEAEEFKILNLPISEEDCSETMGLRIDVAVKYWFDKYNFNKADINETSDKILKRVIELVNKKGELLPGVLKILNVLKNNNIPMAIASSSAIELIEAVLKTCNIKNYFNAIASAEFEEYGKPHPAVFLSAAKKLAISPEKCLVFEDSISGIISAKAALMKTIAVPSNIVKNDPKFIIADKILNSLEEFDIKLLKTIL